MSQSLKGVIKTLCYIDRNNSSIATISAVFWDSKQCREQENKAKKWTKPLHRAEHLGQSSTLTQCTDPTGPWLTALPQCQLLKCAASFLTIYIDENLLISTYVNIIAHGLPSKKISWIKGNLIVLVIFRQMQLVKQNHLQQSAPKGFSVY